MSDNATNKYISTSVFYTYINRMVKCKSSIIKMAHIVFAVNVNIFKQYVWKNGAYGTQCTIHGHVKRVNILNYLH